MIDLEESQIIQNWSASTKVLVSINCLTYNHASFITTALNGFLIQKTSFPFEIIIGEDCSTDNTLKILHTYKEKFPSIIQIIANDKNIGPYKNGMNVLKASSGKYIALCEGDDYWTDPLKLQKQVDFLEKNPNYVITYATALSVDNTGKILGKSSGTERDLSQDELLKAQHINTLTACFRNIFQPLPDEFIITKFGDLFLWSLLGQYGKGKYMENIQPSIYRIHEQGIFSTKSKKEKYEMALITDFTLFSCFSRSGNETIKKFYKNKMIHSWILSESYSTILTLVLAYQINRWKRKIKSRFKKIKSIITFH